MIAALAGRRIDASGAAAQRFPMRLRDCVRQRIDEAFTLHGTTALVCAAACGADLIALEIARARGIESRIVLPYAAAQFRRTSVVDRGPEWGPAFDEVLADATVRGSITILGLAADDPRAFHITNGAILDEAIALAHGELRDVSALAIWDGPFGAGDYTADFTAAAEVRGVAVESIPILPA